ncbi:cytochrome c family protein [Pseudodesulfovibrio senegalensis]|uniref:Cytochrome C n=1 Tax=Pseudodesulfovibrio senegalensis TaxID=1721087 RepID=A0A6N6N3V7_9BACT|nr:cytochrome c family protein [Pseudodesulfovibrio senegalensis]KAB1442724.1 cytochrome C [Pseudodesulfovibrio senegalensis]
MGVFRLLQGSCCALCVAALFVCWTQVAEAGSGRFVGNAACADCHEEEYANYTEFSKKAHSGKSVQLMAADLTADELKECYACHATGYGQPGGFVSFEETPELGNAGCEVCHGPGYDHVESGGDPELIKGDIKVSDCEICHNSERVAAFDYKPLLFGGAH